MEIIRLACREEPLDCVGSVVLYRNPPEMVRSVVESFLSAELRSRLYVVDNSPTPLSHPLFSHPAVFYHHVGQNLGYGRGHNWAVFRSEPSRYHLILNPDVVFGPGVLERLTAYLDENPSVGMISPRVLNADGSLQHLNKRYPSVLDLFLRRFYTWRFLPCLNRRLDRYEMRDVGYDEICEVPFMTGAFMLCRTEVLRAVGGFDPRYFLYFEDADLSRRIQAAGYKTVYYPHVRITHLWQRASQKRLLMALVFMVSGIKYFHKWGWKLA